jgi:P4 family phage/plasmid primase-like protien
MTTEMPMPPAGETRGKETAHGLETTAHGTASKAVAGSPNSNGGASNSPLSPEHQAEILSGSAVAREAAGARGYRTLLDTPEDRALLAEWGFSRQQVARGDAYPMLYIPVYRATGEQITAQIKPSAPRQSQGRNGDAREIKYETPAGSAVHIDVPPFTQRHIRDTAVPLWVTEGVKKADALVSRELAAIGITGVYNWRSKLGTLGDWEDIPLKERTVVVCFDADAAKNMNVLRAMNRLGAWLKSKGATPHYLIVPPEVNGTQVKGVDDYFAAGGTPEGLHAATSTRAPDTATADGTYSDAFMAETVADDVFDGRFCYTSGAGWLRWDGRVWLRCKDDSEAVEAVRQYIKNRFADVVEGLRTSTGQPTNGNAIDGWRSLLSSSRIGAITKLARGIVKVDDDLLDADRDLLNTPSGIVDMRTRELLPSDPGRYMTRITAAGYDPQAVSADWDRILTAVTEETVPYLQGVLGQSITGHRNPRDQALIMSGGGHNGKSCTVAAVTGAVGGYSALVPDAVLIGHAQRDETMVLRGARLVLIEELPQGAHLNAVQLKKATSPTMSGHHLYQSMTEWATTHSLIVTTNYRPIVSETDEGTWRRIRLIEFPYTYVFGTPQAPDERAGDPTLISRVEAGSPEILAAALRWLVDGAHAWYEAGRVLPKDPERVRSATRAWREETDLVLAFWGDQLIADRGAHIAVSDMLAAFNDWAKERQNKPLSDRLFGPRFGDHSETRAHQVVKSGRSRDKEGSSRPAADPFGESPAKPLPEMYDRWSGVRFRTDADDMGDESGGVHGVHAKTKLPKSLRIEGLSFERAHRAHPLPGAAECTCPGRSHDPFSDCPAA